MALGHSPCGLCESRERAGEEILDYLAPQRIVCVYEYVCTRRKAVYVDNRRRVRSYKRRKSRTVLYVMLCKAVCVPQELCLNQKKGTSLLYSCMSAIYGPSTEGPYCVYALRYGGWVAEP